MEAQKLEKKFSSSERMAYKVASFHLKTIGLHPWMVHIKHPDYKMSVENIIDKTHGFDIERWYKNEGVKVEDLPPRDQNKLNKLMAKFNAQSTNPLDFNLHDLCKECSDLSNDFTNKVDALKNAPKFIERVFNFLKENHGVDDKIQPLSTDNYAMTNLVIEDGGKKYPCVIGWRPKQSGGQIFMVWVHVPDADENDSKTTHSPHQVPCLKLETFSEGATNILPELEVDYKILKVGPQSLMPLVKITGAVQSAIAFANLARKTDIEDEDAEEPVNAMEQSNPAK